MGETSSYAFSTWIFLRALSVVYLVAFASLLNQARGLWGAHGILPMAEYLRRAGEVLGSSRWIEMPTLFWLNASDTWIVGLTLVGATAALLAGLGFAQGFMLFVCYLVYLSYVSAGRTFMAFQWDILLLEVGFLALFAAPWATVWAPWQATEAHWTVRAMFYLILFKLMFLSGVVKLQSGDPAWRDGTALSFHYFTQPLPNPLSALANALPLYVQRFSTYLTFVVELGLPFLIFFPATRILAAIGIAALSGLILFTGNFAFFNWLTLSLCVWLVPDEIWSRATLSLGLPLEAAGSVGYAPLNFAVTAALASWSMFWCTQWFLPEAYSERVGAITAPVQGFRLSSAYGLFAVMTKTRPEIVLEGTLDGEEWREYEFYYKPGALDRRPPVIAPFQPRLDWQMWFAALGGGLRYNPWLAELMERMEDNTPEVMGFFANRPFGDQAPKRVRAHLYEYELNSPTEIWRTGNWWRRRDLNVM